MITKVEVLVQAATKEIITIQPSGHGWGKGDLTGRFVFCTELDLPCGDAWKKSIRCSQCEHMGLDWGTLTPSVGAKGVAKMSCEQMKYAAAEVSAELELDIHGIPQVKETLISKNRGLLDYSKATELTTETIATVEAETGAELISDTEKEKRLENARENPVSKDLLSLKILQESK